jgi:hypothetical protein
MTTATVKRGFEGKIYIGTAGSTASTQLTERTDITYNMTMERAESTVAGAGTNIPMKTEEPVCVGVEISWKQRYTTEDTSIATMIAQMLPGATNLIAVKIIRYASDTDAFDGDCSIDFSSSLPLKDNTEFEIKAVPSRRLREPVFG